MRPRLILAGTIGAVFLLAGCGAAVLAWMQSNGAFGTNPHRFTTTTAALKSDEIAVGEAEAHADDPNPDIGEIAQVRIKIHADPLTPLFVGIGPKDKVEAYLRGTAYDDFATATLSPFKPTFRRTDGRPDAQSPTAQSFWVATAVVRGSQTLNWNKTHGRWSIVVMRLDGRPGVDATAAIALRFGFLTPTAAALAIAGAAVLIASLRRRPNPSATAAGDAPGHQSGGEKTTASGSRM